MVRPFSAEADDVDEDVMAAPPRKGGKIFFPAKADESVATLPGVISGGSKSAFDKDELAAPPRRGGKPIFSASVNEVSVGDNFPDKESISQEYQASDDMDKAPQQRSGPFLFETPRISKSGGLRADPSPPYEPISTRKVQQHDVASYTMPEKPSRQLTKLDLSACDFTLLQRIETVANSLPYLGNEVFRNDLILDSELRTSTALTCFFLDGGVTVLQPGFNLLRDEYDWKRVPNNVFFNAIRMAWNNFLQRGSYSQGVTSSASSDQRNADVVWLEGWASPSSFVPPGQDENDFPPLGGFRHSCTRTSA